MCIYKPEVRPGLDGIIDYIDVINDVKSKVSPLLTLIAFSDVSLTEEEISDLTSHVNDMLGEAWLAADGIYKIYRKENGYAD